MVHFLEICLFLSVFGFTRAREPQCSNFDFQEKLLEKAVRSEIKMETIEASLEKLSKKSEREYQLMRGKFKNIFIFFSYIFDTIIIFGE